MQVTLLASSNVYLPSFPGYFGVGAGLAVVVVTAGVVGGLVVVVGGCVVVGAVVGLAVVVVSGGLCAETPRRKTETPTARRNIFDSPNILIE